MEEYKVLGFSEDGRFIVCEYKGRIWELHPSLTKCELVGFLNIPPKHATKELREAILKEAQSKGVYENMERKK